MAEFTAAHPGVELDFTELTYVTHYAAVADGSVDVAFCRLPLGADGLCHGPIVLRDQRMLCVPHDHPFAAAHLLDPELLARERLVRMVPGSVNQEWQDYHFPRHTPRGKPIGDGPIVRTVREGIEAVNARQGLLMLTKRAASYYATPQIAFVEIDLPAMPSALVRRIDDHRPILQELDALLLRIAMRYGGGAGLGPARPAPSRAPARWRWRRRPPPRCRGSGPPRTCGPSAADTRPGRAARSRPAPRPGRCR